MTVVRAPESQVSVYLFSLPIPYITHSKTSKLWDKEKLLKTELTSSGSTVAPYEKTIFCLSTSAIIKAVIPSKCIYRMLLGNFTL